VSVDGPAATREVLQSWKEISAYLGRDIRTCRRWEESLGLPVHRLDGSPKARVMAYKDEIDWWLDAKLHEHDSSPAAGPGPQNGAAGPAAVRLFGFRLPVSSSALRRWSALVAFTAVMVACVLGWRAITNGRPRYVPDGRDPMIAVLPFVNVTGDGALEYLRESVPDHLIRDLQRSSEHLQVLSFQAVMEAVRRLDLDRRAPLTFEELASVSDRLGAGWVVIGSFERRGSALRVDYEVREARAVASIKAGRIPGREGEISAVEARLANGVRRAFGVPASAEPSSLSLCSVQATRFYEAARAVSRKYWLDPSPPVLAQIIDLFMKARDADPGCPLAYLGLGDAYQFRFVYETDTPEVQGLMEENYQRAFEMAPDRAETNVGLAWVYFLRKDNDQAYACLQKAMAIDPSSLLVLAEVGGFLRSIGLFERAVEFYSRVIKAGGKTAEMYMLRGYTYEQMGLYESALADYDRIIALDPGDYRAHCHLARVLLLLERYDAAGSELTLAATMAPGAPLVRLVRGLSAAAAGDRKGALEALQGSFDAARPSRGTAYRSRIYAALGMLDDAMATITMGIQRGFEDVYDYLYTFPYLDNTRDHFYDPLRKDPRFAGILGLEERKYSENLDRYGGL
jgi:tetratricopeptide (TPR) repeat protein